MLILSRKLGEHIYIGDGPRRIVITVVDLDQGKVRIGIRAPKDVLILRSELVKLPEPQCRPVIRATAQESNAPRRTKSEVRAAKGTVIGCCNRHADNLACDCMRRAVECSECDDTGYAVHSENGWNRNSRRCSRGCRVRCSICSNPDCDNPDGQH